MRKVGRKALFCGVLAGAILVSGIGYASSNIKLMVNGKEIKTSAPIQNVNGSTVVPVRSLAEALGAEVKWDKQNQIIHVKSKGNLQQDASKSRDAYVIEDQKVLLSLPSEWKEKIKVEKRNNEVIFSYVPKNKAIKSDYLFNIDIIEKAVWDKDEYAETGLFSPLGTMDGKVYALHPPSEAPYFDKPDSIEYKECIQMLNALKQSAQLLFIR